MATEVFVDLFRNRPSLAAEILEEVLHVPLPSYTEARLASVDLTQINSLNDAARRALETLMKGYEYQSDFAKKYVAEGRAEGAVRALLAALRARGIPVPEAARERIVAEKDIDHIERWLERAFVATSLAEVLTEPS